jgi:SET domain-containing protein
MFLIRANVAPSTISGMGCFAGERIAHGQVVWVFEPRMDVRLSIDEVAALPAAAREFWHKHGYAEMQDGRKVITLCGDHAKHLNHADTPNLVSGPDDGDTYVAARDIEAGEELTCDYYSFDVDTDRKLGKR